VFARDSLNDFLALGRSAWHAVRVQLQRSVEHGIDDELLVPQRELSMRMPVAVGDYVDMYAGIHHATNLGRLFRPDGEPLLANWRHIPVGYHGRAGSIVVSGTDVRRPCGHVVVEHEVRWQPSERLDIELEVGFVVGTPSRQGTPIAIESVADHIFGFVLVNDWSARDIQSFEYQPLGPFLGKSFATSVSPWLVPLDALAPALVPGLPVRQSPRPAAHLCTDTPWVPPLHLEVALQTAAMEEPQVVSRVDLADGLYWSPAQQLAHLTSNGAAVRTGDLIASGTISGPDDRTQAGSLIELTRGGTEPLQLASGETRTFLEDGDRVVLRGWCGEGPDRVEFGEVAGTIRAATGGA
jgi:fumarylacetoacetase